MSKKLFQPIQSSFTILCCYLVLVFVPLGQQAFAQDAAQEALDLSRQGMAQYNNLEVEGARATLNRALQVAARGGVTGAPLARIYVNLGIVFVGGLQDNAAGMEAFGNALREDPDVRLDPLTATPEINTVFRMAKRQLDRPGSSSSSRNDSDGFSEDPSSRERLGGGATGSSGALPEVPHEAVREQLEGTAVPVYVEVPDEAPVEEVVVYYRGGGLGGFERTSMDRMDGGFGTTLPCTAVLPPEVEYYFIALGPGQEPIGQGGTEDAPTVVPVVTTRSFPPASLPGQPPPPDGQCSGGSSAELDEPVAPSENAGGLACAADDECPMDYACEDGLCQIIEEAAENPVPMFVDVEEAPRFFVHAAGFWGSAFAGSGMPADSNPPASDPTSIGWVPESMSPEAGGLATPCDNNGDDFVDYCVRLENSGIVPTFGFRFAVGYYVLPRLALAAFMRWQPNSGRGTLAGILLGGRVQYEFTRPSARGLHFSAYLGTSGGQIQPQPPQNGLAEEPFIRSGLNGIQVGSVFSYRFVKNFGVIVTPEIMFQLPEFLFNIDVAAGLEFAF